MSDCGALHGLSVRRLISSALGGAICRPAPISSVLQPCREHEKALTRPLLSSFYRFGYAEPSQDELKVVRQHVQVHSAPTCLSVRVRSLFESADANSRRIPLGAVRSASAHPSSRIDTTDPTQHLVRQVEVVHLNDDGAWQPRRTPPRPQGRAIRARKSGSRSPCRTLRRRRTHRTR